MLQTRKGEIGKAKDLSALLRIKYNHNSDKLNYIPHEEGLGRIPGQTICLMRL
jgi:hypothetical protein